jgi:hypothetical protein
MCRSVKARQLHEMLDVLDLPSDGGRGTRSIGLSQRVAGVEKKLPLLLWNCLQERLRQIEELDQDIRILEKEREIERGERRASSGQRQVPNRFRRPGLPSASSTGGANG